MSNFELTLAGKVALVTGGGSGIGLAVAQTFLRAGARVASMDLQHSVPLDPGHNAERFLPVAGDVTQEADCERALQSAVARFGTCDILVNAAGIVEKPRRTINQSTADWKRTLDVNLLGTYAMSKATARHMTAHRVRGAIVNLASVAGMGGFKASNAYGVSKAAVQMLTKTMAIDLAENNIRVNAVAPGFVNTPMTANLQAAAGEVHEAFLSRIPMRRFGEVEEIARLILFLSSDWASYMTGAVIAVDGGWSAFSGPSEL